MKKNPVIRTAKWAISLMKNQIVLSLVLLIQGVIFIVAPSGDMTGAVTIIAIILIVAALINIGIHLIPKEREKIDIFLSVINLLLIGVCVFSLISPSTVEPLIRYFFAILTIFGNIANLIGVFKLENKKSWRFFVGLFVSVIMIGLGIAMFIAEESVIAAMQQGIGLFLIINSLMNIWYIIRLYFEAKRAKKNG